MCLYAASAMHVSHSIITARTSSVSSLDSLDLTRYSDEGEGRHDDRVAVLEFELRKAHETIKSLRTSLTRASGVLTAIAHMSVAG